MAHTVGFTLCPARVDDIAELDELPMRKQLT
jgi:hypothetical protein